MKNFENKATTAILSFAVDLNSIMENTNNEIAEKLAAAYEENQNVSIENLKKIICNHVIDKLSEKVKDGE